MIDHLAIHRCLNSAPSVAPCSQGNLALYSEPMMAKRKRLREHPGIQQAIQVWTVKKTARNCSAAVTKK